MTSILLDDIENILIASGIYPNKKTLQEDSYRALFRSKPELTRKLAIELYSRHEISLTCGAEISGLNIENFKELLRENGVKIDNSPDTVEEVHSDVDALLGALSCL